MATNSVRVDVKRYPTCWKLSTGNWSLTLTRSPVVDKCLRTGTATLTTTTEQIVASLETRTGGHTATRTEVTGRVVECTGRRALQISADMIQI